MANEITLSVQLRCINGSYDSGQYAFSKQVTQTGQGAASGVQVIGTANEALTVGDVTTYGYIFLQNIDSTNYVTYGSTAGLENKLKAGEIAIHRFTPGATIEFKANASPVKVQYLLLMD